MSGRFRTMSVPFKAKKTFAYLWLVAIFVSLIVCLLSEKAAALPWDIDMYKQESFKANEIARAPAKNTVPLGHSPFRMTNEEAAKSLTNPTTFSFDSVWRGQRLYNSNCWTCHGKSGAAEGPVAKQSALGIPDLLTDFYRNSPDGKVFAVIYNGGSNMPRYGFKFSKTEIWDIVNYLRFLQGQDVEGQGSERLKRPAKVVSGK